MKAVRYFFFCCCGILLGLEIASAQALRPSGISCKTRQDWRTHSVRTSFRYPLNWKWYSLAEDHPFRPFEYIDRTFIPTRTDSTSSYDSVVYTLMTFELDSLQSLALPIYVIEANEEKGEADSIAIFTAVDSVYLQQLITQLPDSLTSRRILPIWMFHCNLTIPTYLSVWVSWPIVLIVYLVFGEKIRKYLKLRRLRKTINALASSLLSKLKSSVSRPTSSNQNIHCLWKRYMERLERTPSDQADD